MTQNRIVPIVTIVIVLCPLLWGMAHSVVKWLFPSPSTASVEPVDVAAYRSKYEKLHTELAGWPRVVSIARDHLFGFVEIDFDAQQGLTEKQCAFLEEFQTRDQAVFDTNALIQALRGSDRTERLEKLKEDLSPRFGQYLDARVEVEKLRREALEKRHSAQDQSDLEEVVQLCNQCISKIGTFPFSDAREEVEHLKTDAIEERDWHRIRASAKGNDDEIQLALVSDFLQDHPESEHVAQAKSLQGRFQANVDWQRTEKQDATPATAIEELHDFVVNHPDDTRVYLAVDRASALLQSLFDEPQLSPKTPSREMLFHFRRDNQVIRAFLVHNEGDELVVRSNDKERRFFREALAEAPEFTEEHKRAVAFNEARQKANSRLLSWDAEVLERFAQQCVDLEYLIEAGSARQIAAIVRSCPKFQNAERNVRNEHGPKAPKSLSP